MKTYDFDFPMISGAEFSDCKKYRYSLWRIWDSHKPKVMFIGLNPSTANAMRDDPTIKRVCSIAKHNGFGGVYMMNLFPLVSTDPSVLQEVYDLLHEEQDIENMRHLLEVKRKCKEVVFAWGNFHIAKQRAESVIGYFTGSKALHINKNGTPKHPLYCKSSTIFMDFNPSPSSGE